MLFLCVVVFIRWFWVYFRNLLPLLRIVETLIMSTLVMSTIDSREYLSRRSAVVLLRLGPEMYPTPRGRDHTSWPCIGTCISMPVQ